MILKSRLKKKCTFLENLYIITYNEFLKDLIEMQNVRFIKHTTIWQERQEMSVRFNDERAAHDKMKTLSEGSGYA